MKEEAKLTIILILICVFSLWCLHSYEIYYTNNMEVSDGH